jgi:hypothetical protein
VVEVGIQLAILVMEETAVKVKRGAIRTRTPQVEVRKVIRKVLNLPPPGHG